LTSAEGLADPFHRDLTLDRDFLTLPRMGGLITDQHLQERDRMGRTVAFLARLVKDGWTAEARAIAADRETALHVDPSDGSAEVFSTPTHPTPFVYFLRTPGPPEVCEPNTPLTFRNVAVYRIGPGGRFDIPKWRGAARRGGRGRGSPTARRRRRPSPAPGGPAPRSTRCDVRRATATSRWRRSTRPRWRASPTRRRRSPGAVSAAGSGRC